MYFYKQVNNSLKKGRYMKSQLFNFGKDLFATYPKYTGIIYMESSYDKSLKYEMEKNTTYQYYHLLTYNYGTVQDWDGW